MSSSDVIITDGSVDWSGGIDSQATTTIQSPRNPNGIQRNQLCWLDNATVRDGGITCRSGFSQLATIADRSEYFQGKFMYAPAGANPYEVYSISGHILIYNVDAGTLVDITELFPGNVPQFNPGGDLEAYFVQAERFLVIQAGDYQTTGTLPFIWDGATLRRSNGMTGNVGQPVGVGGATYNLLPTVPWVVPAVGASTPVSLTANYPGVIGNVGVWTNNLTTVPLGTFEVTFVGANTFTIKTLSSNYVGSLQLAGFDATFVVAGTPAATVLINEIPAAGPMDYFMGRIWYGQGRQVSAGDIVRGPSGTAAYDFDDSVLKVTENPMVISGDGFTIPTSDGTIIRGIKHSANIDAALGQGRLFLGTAKAIYALNVPVTRDQWIAATNGNQPLITVVQVANGWVNDRSVTTVNGDLFYQSLEPGIRSLLQCMRYFNQWGNIQISSNENRILQYNDRALLKYSSGMYYDNRMLQTSLPVRTDQGVVSHALIPMDFTPISSFNKERQPNWEGMYEGLDFFQINTGDFGGRERAFATARSREDASIQLWELIAGTKFDHSTTNGENRITWVMEFPAFTWGDENELKRLVGAELWIDRLTGTVQFTMEYRPDGQACWIPWHMWKKCSTKNSEETVANPYAYPLTPCLESYFSTMTLPIPPQNVCTATGRPSDIAYQIQPRLTITGFCRVRGLYLHATKVGRKLYQNLTC